MAQRRELARCKADYAYFLHTYVQIEDPTSGGWLPFHLWPAQADVLQTMMDKRHIVVLKARQLGLSWLTLAYVLAEMLFNPITVALFFSRGETEAKELMARIKGIYQHLPPWMHNGPPLVSNTQEWRMATGSRALSFPTTGGRSYTASIVVIDEADFIDRFNEVMNAVKPTIDAGGKMFLISTVDKAKPASPFKAVYRGAVANLSDWTPIFLPWHVRPDRDAGWYADRKADVLARTGALDDLHQEYPATDSEALAPRSLDKRVPPQWLERVFVKMTPLSPEELAADAAIPAIPNLELYRRPRPDRTYVMGIDPAEGNPTSNSSALTVLDAHSGEEVAAVTGQFQPEMIAHYANRLGLYYNQAAVMVERNNHGHAVLLALRQSSPLRILSGRDGRPGWLSSRLGKTMLYDNLTEAIREESVLLHSLETNTQIGSIEGSSLSAPENQPDDRADSFALAVAAIIAALTPPVSLNIPASSGHRSHL